MLRLSMNEMTTYRWSFEEDISRYRQAGYAAVGVWRQKLADFGEDKGIELLAESGLKVSNLLWAGGFTGNDGRSFGESLDDALEAIELAAAMQAGCLVVHSGGRGGHTHNHARRIVRDAFKKLLPAATEAHVILAVEPMHPLPGQEWTLFSSLLEAIELIRALESPWVKLAFDTYHLGRDPAAVALLPQLVDELAVVHLADSKRPPCREQNRCRLGDGTVPLGNIVDTLNHAGYRGFFDVELMGEEIEGCDYEQLLLDSRETYSQWAFPSAE